MPDNNIPFVQFGQGAAVAEAMTSAVNQAVGQISGFTQIASATSAMNLIGLAAPTQVMFNAISTRTPKGKTGDLTLLAGDVIIPAASLGRLSVKPTVKGGAALLLTLEARLYDIDGNLLSESDTGFPCTVDATLSVNKNRVFATLPVITKTEVSAKDWRLRLFASAAAALAISSINLEITKFTA